MILIVVKVKVLLMEFVVKLQKKLGTKVVENGEGDDQETLDPGSVPGFTECFVERKNASGGGAEVRI